MSFNLLKKSKKSAARRGQLKTRRGIIETPFFMPIATKGAVKSLTIDDLHALEAQIVLSNTYHLWLRPGEKILKRAGGLHEFMQWQGPILTDSGGFQIFSLGHRRKMMEKGVEFRSHIDGSKIFMRPEDSIRMQMAIGSDIMMVLDECVALPARIEYVRKSIALSSRWAARCKAYFDKQYELVAPDNRPLLFGIVQGGLTKEFRLESVQDLVAMGFDGYAIGGLAVGEVATDRNKVLDYTCPALPDLKPRYLMGIGKPVDIIEAVNRGVDMFDCVIPTREARHGRLYVWNKRIKNVLSNPDKCYTHINIRSEVFARDFTPINKDSQFELLRTHTKAYLRHLFSVQEPLAQRLATLNNLEFYLTLMKRIREEI